VRLTAGLQDICHRNSAHTLGKGRKQQQKRAYFEQFGAEFLQEALRDSRYDAATPPKNLQGKAAS
jgi:hypothetical protein